MGAVSTASGLLPAVVNGGEQELSQQTGVGIYVLRVDMGNLQAGDTLEILIKTRCRYEDDVKATYLESFTGVQVQKNWDSIPVMIVAGQMIVCTIQQTAGVARTFPWNLMRA